MEEASAPQSEGPDARERILRAATELIASDGIDEVRIARVANRARASTALVHHYFSTREELLAQALLQSFELAADERFVAGPAAAASATEGLAIAIEECLPTPGEGEREWVLWVELWLRAVRHPELRPTAARLYERMHTWFVDAIEAGGFDCDADRVADHAMALLDGLGLRALLGDPEMPIERARDEVWDALARELGLAPAAVRQ